MWQAILSFSLQNFAAEVSKRRSESWSAYGVTKTFFSLSRYDRR
jgi:hypothetical protein